MPAHRPSPKLWLVRHARPLIEADRCYGRLDVPADPAHTQETAQALAQALAGRMATAASACPAPLLWCSPLQRTRQLGLALQAQWQQLPHPTGTPGLDIVWDWALAELDFGAWEGRPWHGLPVAELQAWTDDFMQYRPGGGEALAQLLQRVEAALQRSHAQALARNSPCVVWITHAGVIRAVEVLRQHPQPQTCTAADWPAGAPAYGGWVALNLNCPYPRPAPGASR